LSATSNLTADTVIPGSTNDKIGDTVAKIVDLEREVNETIDKYVDLKKRVLRTIAKVEDPAELRLLYLRYFRYMSWEQIACEMGYSYRNVCYIHSNALQSVEKIREGKWRDKKRKPE
jgi:DNA-directed RNA polymerase specialized sigma subunit